MPGGIAKEKLFVLFERGEVKFGPIFEKTAKGRHKRDRGGAAHDARYGGLIMAKLGDRGTSPSFSKGVSDSGVVELSVFTAYSGERNDH